MHDEAAGKADSRIDLNRTGTPLLEIVSQPDMRSPAEGEGVSRRAEAAADLPRRLRLQHAGRQPAGRCQHQPARRHARGQGRHADRRSQEHEQLPRRRAGAWSTKPSGSTQVWQETGQQTGRRAQADPRLGRRGRRHARPAAQGRIERLPLLPRSRSGAGRDVSAEQIDAVRGVAGRIAGRAARAAGSDLRHHALRQRRAREPGPARWSTTSSSWPSSSATASWPATGCSRTCCARSTSRRSRSTEFAVRPKQLAELLKAVQEGRARHQPRPRSVRRDGRLGPDRPPR